MDGTRYTLLGALLLVGCASTIPAGTPSTRVPLGNRDFADFEFEVAPPPKDEDLAACRALAQPMVPGRGTGAATFSGAAAAPIAGLAVGAIMDVASHRHQARVFTDCMVKRGYAVERADVPPVR